MRAELTTGESHLKNYGENAHRSTIRIVIAKMWIHMTISGLRMSNFAI